MSSFVISLSSVKFERRVLAWILEQADDKMGLNVQQLGRREGLQQGGIRESFQTTQFNMTEVKLGGGFCSISGWNSGQASEVQLLVNVVPGLK